MHTWGKELLHPSLHQQSQQLPLEYTSIHFLIILCSEHCFVLCWSNPFCEKVTLLLVLLACFNLDRYNMYVVTFPMSELAT